MGWPQGLWSTDGRGFTPPFFDYKGNPLKSDKTLSILIDESGDFGKFDSKDPNYHVVMVIHEQQDDITDRVKTFNRTLSDRGYANHYIHVGPLIRREKTYIEFERQENRVIILCGRRYGE